MYVYNNALFSHLCVCIRVLRLAMRIYFVSLNTLLKEGLCATKRGIAFRVVHDFWWRAKSETLRIIYFLLAALITLMCSFLIIIALIIKIVVF